MGKLTAQQIYENFHDNPPGPGKLEAAAKASNDLHNQLKQRAVDIQKAAAEMQKHWKGNASEAAARGAAPLSDLQLMTSNDNKTAHSLNNAQIRAWHTAKNKTNKVPPKPSLLDKIGAAEVTSESHGLNPAYSNVLDQSQHHDAVSKANIAAYKTYHGSSTDNGYFPSDTTKLPEDTPPIKFTRTPGPGGGPGSVPPSTGNGGGPISYGNGDTAPSWSGVPDPGSNNKAVITGTTHAGTSYIAPPTTGSSGGGFNHSGGGVISQPGGTWTGTGPARVGGGQSSQIPGVGGENGGESGDGPYGEGYFGTGKGRDSRGRAGRNPATGEPFGMMPLTGGTGGRGGDAARPGGYGPGGYGSGGEGGVPGGGRGFGGGSGGSGGVGGSEPGAGGRAGLGGGPGAAAAEAEAMRTGAAGAGRGGMPFAPLGGRGRGGEDYVHQRAEYLEENDPDSLFGSSEKTVPPVIGAYDDDGNLI